MGRRIDLDLEMAENLMKTMALNPTSREVAQKTMNTLTLIVVAFFGLLAGSVAAATSRPNVVLVMSDDQGWGDVGYNGHPHLKTPQIDQLSRSGLRLDRFYAAHYNCSPTRGSVMTGRHPARYGTNDAGSPFRVEELTVAEVIRTAGYATGHFGKWHLSGVGDGVGAPIPADAATSPGNCGFDEWVSVTNFYDLDPLMARNGQPEQFKGDGSDVATDEALKFIRRHARAKKPFLAVVWFGSPHTPHQALESDKAPYRERSEKLQNYYGEITAIDRSVGRLRQELRDLNVADNTLFWFCSDNGGHMGPTSTGNLRGMKGSFWEGGIRVPGIIEWPARIGAPFTSKVPVSTLDIYPTVLAAVGVTAPNQVQPLDGLNVLPLLDRKMTARTKPMPFFDTVPRHGPKGRKISEVGLQPGHAVWFDYPWKFHRNAVLDRPHRGSDLLPPILLYNIEQDPNEATDLSAQQPERVARMKAELEAWKESVARSLAGADYGR